MGNSTFDKKESGSGTRVLHQPNVYGTHPTSAPLQCLSTAAWYCVVAARRSTVSVRGSLFHSTGKHCGSRVHCHYHSTRYIPTHTYIHTSRTCYPTPCTPHTYTHNTRRSPNARATTASVTSIALHNSVSHSCATAYHAQVSTQSLSRIEESSPRASQSRAYRPVLFSVSSRHIVE